VYICTQICRQVGDANKIEELNMSVLLLPVVAFAIAVVGGRIGTVMFQEQDAQD